MFALLAFASAFMPVALRPAVSTTTSAPRLATSVHMVDDPKAKAAAAVKAKAAAAAKAKAKAAPKAKAKAADDGDAEAEETEEEKAAREAKEALYLVRSASLQEAADALRTDRRT